MSTRFGKYILLHQLAMGGMAEIYLAKQTGLEGFEKLVVLKKILGAMTEQREFVEMFVNEARIAARLNHPHIVQIYDLGRVKNAYFIAMEYVYGEDLRAISKVCTKRGVPLPCEHVARIVSELLQGLHFAHTRTDAVGQPMCIVHRDVSPQNILVSYEGTVKIVDFGIAKATLTPLTMAGVIKGKYAYMSPEQCKGEPLDGRSDVFCAGIILHQLCTGHRLFKRQTDFATLMAVKDAPVPSPRSLRPELPPELERIILKALERDLPKRYVTAQEMQLDLEAFLRKGQYQTGNVALSGLMRELFADKLAAQAEAVKSSRVDSFEALLLEDAELEPSIITGVGEDGTSGEAELEELPLDPDPPHDSSVVTAATVPAKMAPSTRPPVVKAGQGTAPDPGPGLLGGVALPTGRPLAASLGGLDEGAEAAPTSASAHGPLEDVPSTNSGTETDGFLSPGTAPMLMARSGRPLLEGHGAGDGDRLPVTRELSPVDVPMAMEDQETMQLDPERQALSGAQPAFERDGFLGGSALPATAGAPTWPPEPQGLTPGPTSDLAVLPTATKIPETRTPTPRASARGSALGAFTLNRRTVLLAVAGLAVLAALGALLGRLLFGREQLSSFVVKSVPAGAVIELDGLLMQAHTPAQLSSVTVGVEHRLRLSMPGFEPWETTLRVSPPSEGAAVLTVMTRLRPVQAALLLSSTPAGAEVQLDGQPRGVTPLLLVDLTPGPHRLALRKRELGFKQDELVLSRGELRTLELQLIPGAASPGRLSLQSTVPATVSLGGKLLGSTPLDAVEVPAGELELVLRWKNRRRNREKTVRVTVPAGEAAVHKVDLSRD